MSARVATAVQESGLTKIVQTNAGSKGDDSEPEKFPTSIALEINENLAEFQLKSATPNNKTYTATGTFAAKGLPAAKWNFDQSQGSLSVVKGGIEDLQGTFGIVVLNEDTIISNKGRIVIYFSSGKSGKDEIVAVFQAPPEPDATLVKYPDFDCTGWATWT